VEVNLIRVSFAFNKVSHKRFYDVVTFLRRERRSEFHGDKTLLARDYQFSMSHKIKCVFISFYMT
jgi:hypothetical protein